MFLTLYMQVCLLCPCSGHVWEGGIGEEGPKADEEEDWRNNTAFIPTGGNGSGATLWPPQLLWLLPLQWLQGMNDCQQFWGVVFCRSFKWRFLFFSPWTEMSFLRVSAISLKAPSVPSRPPPPPLPVSLVPLKNKRTKRSEKAMFSLLSHTWLTSWLTWFRTSLVSPKVSGTSGKCVSMHIQICFCFFRTDVYLSFICVCVSYRSLNMGDQIALLKTATFEIMQIRFNMVFNEKTGIWECGNFKYCIDDAVRCKTTYTSVNQSILLFKGKGLAVSTVPGENVQRGTYTSQITL